MVVFSKQYINWFWY